MYKLLTLIFSALVTFNVVATEYFIADHKKIDYDQNFPLENTLEPLVDQYFYEGSTRWNPSYLITDDYVIIRYNTNWYQITRFIFVTGNIVLDNGIQIGLSVDEAIKNIGTPSKVDTKYDNTTTSLSYGKLYPLIYNKIASELELIIEENKIKEIVVNRVLIIPQKDIEQIISAKWTSPGSEISKPDIKLNEDHTFTYENYEDEDKTKIGYWKVIDENQLPIIEVSTSKDFIRSLKLPIYKESETTLLIEVNGFCYYLDISI